MAGSERLSLAARLMPTVQRLRRANQHYLSTGNLRRHLDTLTIRPRSVQPPRRLPNQISITATVEQGWRIYTIRPTAATAQGTVVYLHGGCWIHQAGRTHWRWVQQLAREASANVVLPVYPLAHEGGTAAAVVPRVADLCTRSSRTVVMGDSAGGSIAMSATLLLKQRRAASAPALVVLISPVLDLGLDNPEIDIVQQRDPWLAKPGLASVARMWAGDHLRDPILNPIHGDLQGLPPLMIFSGTRDILNPDTRLFAELAINAGVDVRYTELPEHIHVFPLLPIPEGRWARREIITAVRDAFAATVGRPGNGS